MHRTATRFGLIVTVALLAAAKVAAQQAPSAASPHLQPNAGGEAAAVKRVVDSIMEPYLAQEQRTLPRGPTWRRSPDLVAIVAVSLRDRSGARRCISSSGPRTLTDRTRLASSIGVWSAFTLSPIRFEPEVPRRTGRRSHRSPRSPSLGSCRYRAERRPPNRAEAAAPLRA